MEDKCESFSDLLEETFSINETGFDLEHINLVKNFNLLEQHTVELPLPYITPQEINNEIHFLKNKKAPGHDLITNEILKMLPKKAILYLTALFNSCLRFGYFPKIWKHAQIILFQKPGKPKDVLSSYRPVSLLSTLSKLFEKLIASRFKKKYY